MITGNIMYKFFVFSFMSLFLVGCVTTPKTQMTPLEIQSMQVKKYENNKDVVFSSVVSMFQDLGYIINSADKDTGFISAVSATQSDKNYAFWTGGSRTSQTNATSYIEKIGKYTRVRLNFVETTEKSSAYGRQDKEEIPILDVKLYQSAFERIENGIFVRSEK
ncbi:hypothetical protein CI610_03412 [invertebrate metagenome]|uniref:Uncharacterized protein n=1 Tax=invertebrate metagenome TaxID=1711999 RepID=A0A2H9T362_9ZZZZ